MVTWTEGDDWRRCTICVAVLYIRICARPKNFILKRNVNDDASRMMKNQLTLEIHNMGVGLVYIEMNLSKNLPNLIMFRQRAVKFYFGI